MREQEIIDNLTAKFPFLEGHISSPAEKRIFTDFMTPEQFGEVITYVHDELDFYRGLHIVGTDEGEDLGFMYLFSNADNIILALREKAPKASPRIKSMSELYPAMLMHEKELIDLFGAEVENIPEGPSYPLPDGWPKGQYPMRKDWNPKYFNKTTMQYEPPADTDADKEAK